jgi:signal transduction histidine kinase
MITERVPAGTSRTFVQDALLAVVVGIVDLTLFSRFVVAPESALTGTPRLALSLGYALLGYLALAWRRRAPVLVFVLVWVHTIAAIPIPGYRPTLAVLVALYTVCVYCSGRTAVRALIGSLIASTATVVNEMVIARADIRVSVGFMTALFLILVNGCVVAFGRWARASRQHTADLERRRELEAREAVATERTRIARELHDIVAHTVTVMILHAAGAQRVLRDDPARARQALGDIETFGKQAMAELRRMLSVLRDEDNDTVVVLAGLDRLGELVESFRRAELEVDLQVVGTPLALDRSVDLAAYRVVQEALTNVTKHCGPGARVDVVVEWGRDRVKLKVRDDGRGRPHAISGELSTGHGLVGLSERVIIVGGQLDFGPVGDGGYEVKALLPRGNHDDSRASR